MHAAPPGVSILAALVDRIEDQVERQRSVLAELQGLGPSDTRSAALEEAEQWLESLEEVLGAAQRNLGRR
ncbi:hypothetical protein [Muricoccus roseus]|nr:hypothetical protein [Roseomonas rosea]